MNSEPEDECEEFSKENLDQMCVDAREQLTNSIRLQWRKLKNHMHSLDTQGVQKKKVLSGGNSKSTCRKSLFRFSHKTICISHIA